VKRRDAGVTKTWRYGREEKDKDTAVRRRQRASERRSAANV